MIENDQKDRKNEVDATRERTEILYGAENIVKRMIGDFHTIKERLDNYTDSCVVEP